MAKGLDKHKERQEKLSLLGKELTRRAKSQCELCSVSGEKLSIVEISPVPVIPSVDHCIFICSTCQNELNLPAKQKLDTHHWKCLHHSVWSEIPSVQVTAMRILKKLPDSDWAQELIEQVYLTEDIENWINQN